MAKLYDQKGSLYQKSSGSISFYKDASGNLKRVPSLVDSTATIIGYIETCMKTILDLKEVDFGEATLNYIQELWIRGEKRTKKVIEMLERRSRELKGSIKALLYLKIREKLERLQVPIFSRAQLAVLNIPSFILDEIDQVLHTYPMMINP